jgi:hypothetical protein
MKKVIKHAKLLFALGLVVITNLARAQTVTPNVVNAAGSSYSGGNLNLSWSVGEISIQTYTSAGNFLTEGLLQPEPIIVSGIKDFVSNGNITVFPNPFSDKIWIKSDNSSPIVHVNIFSITGQKVYDNSFAGGDVIETGDLTPGMYILFAYGKNDNSISTFKILKH